MPRFTKAEEEMIASAVCASLERSQANASQSYEDAAYLKRRGYDRDSGRAERNGKAYDHEAERARNILRKLGRHVPEGE